jgi:hypothetical protein
VDAIGRGERIKAWIARTQPEKDPVSNRLNQEDTAMEVLAVCKKVGEVAGKHCGSGAEVSARIGQGFQYLALSSDAEGKLYS